MDLILENLLIPVEKDGPDAYLNAASERLSLAEGSIAVTKILAKSLDMSDPQQFFYLVSLVVRTADGFTNHDNLPQYTETTPLPGKAGKLRERPVIIGFGPAGIFAALELVDRGIRPLIFERGKKIEERSLDVQLFIRDRVLDPESNIQFGEGGAGSYSDGKLFSRARNSPYANRVLETFIRFGAPPEIAYISKPHLGTDLLCRIVRNMRDHILERGGEIQYGSKMTDLLLSDGRVSGVVINSEKEYRSSVVFLAVGHSGRDTFEMLHRKGIALQQKPISVGVRVEHPAGIINLIRYGDKYKDFTGIGAATYSFTFTNRKTGRGVYTFCMCPGGEVINASSEEGLLVVNGMSYAARASAFSNAALAVTCHTTDYASAGPLAGLEFQQSIERRAFAAGGGRWKVPAQNLPDFLAGRTSSELNRNSYRMGAAAADMKEIFPDFVGRELVNAFGSWKKDYPLFVSDHAILLGPETRTSSPVRIVRREDFGSVTARGLYPIGEGSGYTGGITSSAADALRAVEACLSAAGN
ncbi:MAG: dehydrogenase [Nitrospirae bacterium]|nr:MAG: dehydrogenase [Nitrospirota bacterium]